MTNLNLNSNYETIFYQIVHNYVTIFPFRLIANSSSYIRFIFKFYCYH